MLKIFEIFKKAVSPEVIQKKEVLHDALSLILDDVKTCFKFPLLVYPIESELDAVVVSMGGQTEGRELKFSIHIREDGTYQFRESCSGDRWENIGQPTEFGAALNEMYSELNKFGLQGGKWGSSIVGRSPEEVGRLSEQYGPTLSPAIPTLRDAGANLNANANANAPTLRAA